MGFGAVLSLIVLVFLRGRRGGLFLGVVVAAVIYAIVFAYYVYQSSSTRRPHGAALWAGLVTLRVPDIRAAGFGGEVRVKSERRLRFWTQGQYAVMGRLEVRPEGLSWSAGRFARLLGVRGVLRARWVDIANVEVGTVPGTIQGLGGGIAVHFASGGRVDGQFLGSREHLLDALGRTPLGKRPERPTP
jgi:hypothetical protein